MYSRLLIIFIRIFFKMLRFPTEPEQTTTELELLKKIFHSNATKKKSSYNAKFKQKAIKFTKIFVAEPNPHQVQKPNTLYCATKIIGTS